MSCLIRIEECDVRQKLAQTFDESAFTHGNSAGNPNCRHKKLSAVAAAVSAAKFGTVVVASWARNLAE